LRQVGEFHRNAPESWFALCRPARLSMHASFFVECPPRAASATIRHRFEKSKTFRKFVPPGSA